MTNPPWRGYVNMLTYGLALGRGVDAATVSRRVTELMRTDVFGLPVSDYHSAALAALADDTPLTTEPEHNQAVVRDFLVRLVAELERRRPWPEPPAYAGDLHDWDGLCHAPVIGRTPASRAAFRDAFNSGFHPLHSEGQVSYVLVLRLRTGQTIALRAPAAYHEPGIDILTFASAATTRADVRDLLKIKLDPPLEE